MKTKKGLTLFSGMGGSALGLQQAGIQDVYFNDFEKHAIACLKANFPGLPNDCYDSRDITTITGSDILKRAGLKPRELYIVQMSPPCQDFSILNNSPNKTFSERNKLYAHGLRIAGELQPKIIVIENVAGFVSNQIIFLEALLAFENIGYSVDGWILDSSYYGSVQSRPRTWIVGYRKDLKISPTQPPKVGKPVSVSKLIPKAQWILSTQFGGVLRPTSKPIFTITKTPNFEIIYKNGITLQPTIQQLLVLSDFTENFNIPGSSYVKAWNRIGNAVLPSMMRTLALHILEEVP